MRLKEWYGWHFPEMGKIVPDNLMYAKVNYIHTDIDRYIYIYGAC